MASRITRAIWSLTGATDSLERDLGASKVTSSAEEKAFSHTDLFLTGREVSLNGGSNNVDAAYSNSWVAYSCIRRMAMDAAGIPIVCLSDPDDSESYLPDSHPLVQLFDHPNPYFTTAEFVQWLVTVLNMRGEFFIVFDDPMQPTMMYQYTDPRYWRELKDGASLAGWEYRYEGEHLVRATSEVLQHRFINPSRPYRGMAPLAAAADAYYIDAGASSLQRNIVERGGERSVMYSAAKETTPAQRKQALDQLRARRGAGGRVARDVLLPNGITPIDPKFMQDDRAILDSQQMQPDKICAVYGLSKSLLGMEDIDKYATFEGRMKVYFKQTLIPILHGIEDSFDRYFTRMVSERYQGYVRFDLTRVEALEEDEREQFDIAGIAHDKGLPWTVLNDRFDLGLDVTKIPGADQVMVSSTLAPLDKLIEEWAMPTPPEPAPPSGDDAPSEPPSSDGGEGAADDGEARSVAGSRALTNKTIRKRAGNVRLQLQRQMRLMKAEKAMRNEWKSLVGKYQRKAESAAARITSKSDVAGAMKAALKGFGKEAAELATRYHSKAATEGQLSIEHLVTGKTLSDAELSVYEKAGKWRPGVSEFIKRRSNFIQGMEADLFADVTAAAERAVVQDAGIAEVQSILRQRFHSGPGGINRAYTIARTEVGTAYSVARQVEMKEQGFKKHMWLTAADEAVRTHDTGDFDHEQCHEEVRKVGSNFSCGLSYPMEEGGDPGNVINCRCETIPVVE